MGIPDTADRRALRILARSLARELAADGLDARQLIALASELLDEAAHRLRAQRDGRPIVRPTELP